MDCASDRLEVFPAETNYNLYINNGRSNIYKMFSYRFD